MEFPDVNDRIPLDPKIVEPLLKKGDNGRYYATEDGAKKLEDYLNSDEFIAMMAEDRGTPKPDGFKFFVRVDEHLRFRVDAISDLTGGETIQLGYIDMGDQP